jgi:hypothetical protein
VFATCATLLSAFSKGICCAYYSPKCTRQCAADFVYNIRCVPIPLESHHQSRLSPLLPLKERKGAAAASSWLLPGLARLQVLSQVSLGLPPLLRCAAVAAAPPPPPLPPPHVEGVRPGYQFVVL